LIQFGFIYEIENDIIVGYYICIVYISLHGQSVAFYHIVIILDYNINAHGNPVESLAVYL